MKDIWFSSEQGWHNVTFTLIVQLYTPHDYRKNKIRSLVVAVSVLSVYSLASLQHTSPSDASMPSRQTISSLPSSYINTHIHK